MIHAINGNIITKLKCDQNFKQPHLPNSIKQLKTSEFLDYLPEILTLTMGSFRIQNESLHQDCLSVLKKIQAEIEEKIESSINHVINSNVKRNLESKIYVILVLLNKVEQFKNLLQKRMRLLIYRDQYLQYPIPGTISLLFFFLQEEKILNDLLDRILEE